VFFNNGSDRRPPFIPQEGDMNANRSKCRNSLVLRRLAFAAAIVVATATYSTASLAEQGTAEQRAACTPDVMRLCLSSIYSVKAILACMARNKDSLSNRCRSLLPADVLGALDRGPTAG
jgi:uroporphyrinogen-III synthase